MAFGLLDFGERGLFWRGRANGGATRRKQKKSAALLLLIEESSHASLSLISRSARALTRTERARAIAHQQA